MFPIRIAFLFALVILPSALNTSTAVQNGPEAVPPPSETQSWWSGDSHAFDLKGHSHLVLRDGAVFAPGFVNKAFSFDGDAAHAIFSDGPVLTQVDNWGFEAWIFWRGLKRTPDKRSQFLFSSGESGENGFGLSILEPDACALDSSLCRKEGQLSFRIGGIERHPTGVTIPTNSWIHVAATRENGRLFLYINGEIRFATNSETPRQPQSRFTISSQAEGFYGLMDEPAVYDYAIHQEQIRSIVRAGHAGKIKPQSHRSMPLPHEATLWWSGDNNTEDVLGRWQGTFEGNPQYTIGKAGSAFRFDGTNSYVIRRGAAATMKTDEWSFSFWIRWRGQVGEFGKEDQELFYNGHSAKSGFGLIIPEAGICRADPSLCPHLGKLVVRFGGVHYYPTGVSLDIGLWNHIILSRSGGVLKLYKNTQLEYAEISVSPNTPNAIDSWITLGFSPTYAINGDIDELLIFEKSLSEHEIVGLYVAGTSGTTRSPEFTRIVRHQDNVSIHYQSLTGRRLTMESSGGDFNWSDEKALELIGSGKFTWPLGGGDQNTFRYFRLHQADN
jgi:hypothetical protein